MVYFACKTKKMSNRKRMNFKELMKLGLQGFEPWTNGL